jgi:O-antigen/teichoic acid export membrane protein
MSVLQTIAGSVATKGFGFLASLVIGVILARVLGTEGKGTMDALVAWSLLLLLSYPSLEEPQLFLMGKSKRTPSMFVANGIVVAIAFGTFVVLVFECLQTFVPDLFVYRDRASGTWQSLNLGMLRLLIYLSPLVLLQRILGGVLQGLRDMRSFNHIFLVQNAVLLAGVVFNVLIRDGGVLGAVQAQMAAFVAGGVFAFWACLRHASIEWNSLRPDWALLGSLVVGGLRLHGGVVAAFVIVESDKLIILRFWGPGSLALYASAVALTGHIRKLFLQPIKEVLGSRLPGVASDRDRLLSMLTKTCRHTVLITLAPSLALIILGLPILGLLYGEPFKPAYGPLLVLVPSSLLWTAAVILSYWFIGKNRFLTLTAIGVGLAILNLGLNLWLVPEFGAVGAALTSCFCYAVHLCIFLVVIRRVDGVVWRDFLVPRREDFRVYADAWAKLRARVFGAR